MAAGSEACMATVVKNSVNHKCLDMLESGYGISLRPLTMFARDVYTDCETVQQAVHKAIAVMMFKLERRRSSATRNMRWISGKLLLHQIDFEKQTVTVEGQVHPLTTGYFPTIDPKDPLL